jgi:hypothetical protein
LIGQVVQHKKAKSVFIGAIFGGGYGYLDWNADVEDALKKKKYSAEKKPNKKKDSAYKKPKKKKAPGFNLDDLH